MMGGAPAVDADQGGPTDEQIGAVIAPLYALSTGMSRVIAGKAMVNRLVVLQTVADAGPLRPSAIAEIVNLHQSQITRQVQTLEDEGLLKTGPDSDDKRANAVTVTEQGQAEISRLTQVGLAKWRRFLGDWSSADITELAHLLDKLHTSIQQASHERGSP